MLWSWGPQFASQSDVTVGSLIGNLTKDVSEVLGIVVNRMPVSLVPFRYFITYFTWSICDFEGLCVYLARMLVIVAMSGRVEIASHVRQPIYCCIVCCVQLVRDGLEDYCSWIEIRQYPLP